ncbi:MAG TPA: heparinase II/III family protein, partial [Planctomycetota bacterium]|nr:heparinase II/III family protein [Planctomycetota bacterium]
MDRRDVIRERAGKLCDFPGQVIPEATDELLAKADAISKGTVFFYNTQPVEVGLSGIDWDGRHVHHQEWPAQLNRFGYLARLAAAWRATGDNRYPSATRHYIEDWIDRHPESGEQVERDNRLNRSIRLGSSMHGGWGGTLPAFLDSPSFDDAFLEKVLASIDAQAGWLSENLTTRGNWRISQLDALVFTALRFPFLPSAERILEIGIRGMRSAFHTQFLPDGVHVERTPSYHGWMARVLRNYFLLAQIFPEADAHVTRETLRGPLDYMVQSALSGFNDATAPLADPAELRELEERRALFGDEPPLEQVFPDAGQVFVRSSWSSGADTLAFDASTWGGWHSHLSRLSFVFRSGGRALLTDTGILSYEGSEPIGPYGTSTPAHSTLNVGGRNQADVDAQLMRTEFAADFALIQAKYQGGYWRDPTWKFRDGHRDG